MDRRTTLRHSAFPQMSRRQMLRDSAIGFGSLALAGLLGAEAQAEAVANPMAMREPHFEPKAKRVIFMFMHGGPSQVDTFDYKPQLEKDSGKPLPFALPRVTSGTPGNLLRSPWNFKKYGESG